MVKWSSWHMNPGITRWKLNPLNWKGLPTRLTTFSPIKGVQKFWMTREVRYVSFEVSISTFNLSLSLSLTFMTRARVRAEALKIWTKTQWVRFYFPTIWFLCESCNPFCCCCLRLCDWDWYVVEDENNVDLVVVVDVKCLWNF